MFFSGQLFVIFSGKFSKKHCPVFAAFVSGFFKNILVAAEIFQSADFVQFFVLYRLVYFSEFQKLNFSEKKVKNDNYYEISKIKGGSLFDWKKCDFPNLAKKRSSGEDRANCALQDGMDGFSGDSSIRKKIMYEKGHFFMLLSNFLLVNYYIILLFQQVMFE